MISGPAIDHLLPRLRQRGQVIPRQGQAISALATQASLDVSAPLGSALLVSQGVAKGVVNVLTWWMRDPVFPTLDLDHQGLVAIQADLWTQLWVALGNIAFQARLPALVTLRATPAAQLFGANDAGVALGTRLEDLASVETAVGLGVTSFWGGASNTGYAALGRLLTMDNVLTLSYDFDPVQELTTVLTDLVPKVPDVPTVLAAIETKRQRTTVQAPVDRVLSVLLTDDSDLVQIAEDMYGDPSKWRLLAEYNNLRDPYITDDALDALGPALSTIGLTGPVSAGATVLHLVRVNELYRDQRVLLHEGTTWEVVTITATDDTAQTVTVDPPLAHAYAGQAPVAIYPPTYDVHGVVLAPGDALFVPVSAAQVANAYRGRPQDALASDARLYGVDVEVTALGLLLATPEGDLETVAGRPNLVQAWRNRLVVPLGSYAMHPTYGCGLWNFLGHRTDNYFSFLGVVQAKQTILQDPRTASVDALSATYEGDTAYFEFRATTTAEEQFPQVALAAPMRG